MQFRERSLGEWFARRHPAEGSLAGRWEITVDLSPWNPARWDDGEDPLTADEIVGICRAEASEALMPWVGWEGGELTARTVGDVDADNLRVPPLAACITGAARLMLALLEAAVREAGGTYAFCDTDSLAIVAQSQSGPVACPSGDTTDEAPAITALSWRKVQEIRDRFTALNPYDPDVVPGSILKIEDENFDPTTGDQRALWAYCISAKRYVLYTQNPYGSPLLCKASEHGLGHLLNPTDPDDPDRSWIHSAWGYLLACDGIGRQGDEREPDWLDRPALSRITVSSPEILRLFGPWAAGRDYPHQIKPANFLLAAQVAPFGHPPGVDPARFLLVAPYASDPREWPRLAWRSRFDKNSATYSIQTVARDVSGDDQVATVKSYQR